MMFKRCSPRFTWGIPQIRGPFLDPGFHGFPGFHGIPQSGDTGCNLGTKLGVVILGCYIFRVLHFGCYIFCNSVTFFAHTKNEVFPGGLSQNTQLPEMARMNRNEQK